MSGSHSPENSQEPISSSRSLLFCILVAITISSVSILAHASGFLVPPFYPDGLTGTIASASGDFSGDGKPDFAILGFNAAQSDQVTIMLNNGDGTYSQGTVNHVGPFPQDIKAADLNNDGILDLVTVNSGAGLEGSVTLLLGLGGGMFASPINVTVNAPSSFTLAIGDLNHDGNADLLVGDSPSPSSGFSVLLGNGTGGFSTPQFVNVGFRGGLTLGDFNHDGDLDVAVTGSGISVLFGNGNGTFQPPTNYSSTLFLGSTVAADLNHDGVLDLITGPGAGSLCILSVRLGNSDGTFQSEVDYTDDAFIDCIPTVADMDGDGNLDVVTSGTNAVNIFLGNGDGTLRSPSSYNVRGSITVTPVDVNGDGKLDVAALDFTGLSIITGNGDGTLQAPVVFPFPALGDAQLAVADLNQDHRSDVVATNFLQNSVSVFRGNGDGTLKPPAIYAAGEGAAQVVVSDVNVDGVADLIVADIKRNTLSLLIGNGNGRFQPRKRISDPVIALGGFTLGDVNGDHKPDIVVQGFGNQGSGVAVLLGNGDGTFQSGVLYTATGGATAVALGDLDSNGTLDIAAVTNTTQSSTLSLLLGQGDGTFQSGATYSLFSPIGSPESIRLGDFNNDHHLDVAVGTGSLKVLLGHGDGTFGRPIAFSSTTAGDINPTDFNGDGNLDIISGSGEVSVFLGNGDGTFQYTNYGGGSNNVAVGDFNGDHAPDVVANVGSGLAVLLNTGGTQQGLASSVNPSLSGQSVTFTASVAASVPGSPGGTPTGTITFKDGTTSLGSAPLASGTATLATSSLSVGSHSITAVYSGDPNFNPNTSSVLVQTVNP